MTVVPPGFPHCADTHASVTGVPVRLTLFSARQLQGDFPTSCTRAYTGRPLSSLSDADTAPLLRICHAESYRFLRRLSTHFEDFLLQPHDDPLLKARDIALRNAHQVGDLLLRLFLPSTEAKAQRDDCSLPRGQLVDRVHQELAVDIVLNGLQDKVLVGAENVGEQQLVSVPVGVERLVKADLGLLRRGLAQVHEDLIFNAARGVGRELDVLVAAVRVHCLDEPDRTDGD